MGSSQENTLIIAANFSVMHYNMAVVLGIWYMGVYKGVPLGISQMLFINPRRACAARVTVVVLCVCLSVCLFVCLSATILALQATRQRMSDTNTWRENKLKSQYA